MYVGQNFHEDPFQFKIYYDILFSLFWKEPQIFRNPSALHKSFPATTKKNLTDKNEEINEYIKESNELTKNEEWAIYKCEF